MCNVAPAIAAQVHNPVPNPGEAFAERMIETLNAGAVALMTSLGHRRGLFDCMSEMPPAPWRGRPGRTTSCSRRGT